MPGGKKDAKDDMEVEGEGAEAKDGEGEAKEEEKKPELRPEEIVRDSCKSSLELIERSVTTKEPRFFSRAMRQTAGARKKMNLVAINAVLGCLPDSELKALALRHVAAAPEAPPAEMDVDAGPEAESAAAGGGELDVGGLAVPVLECEVYLFIVAIHYLLDRKCVPRSALPSPIAPPLSARGYLPFPLDLARHCACAGAWSRRSRCRRACLPTASSRPDDPWTRWSRRSGSTTR